MNEWTKQKKKFKKVNDNRKENKWKIKKKEFKNGIISTNWKYKPLIDIFISFFDDETDDDDDDDDGKNNQQCHDRHFATGLVLLHCKQQAIDLLINTLNSRLWLGALFIS